MRLRPSYLAVGLLVVSLAATALLCIGAALNYFAGDVASATVQKYHVGRNAMYGLIIAGLQLAAILLILCDPGPTNR